MYKISSRTWLSPFVENIKEGLYNYSLYTAFVKGILVTADPFWNRATCMVPILMPVKAVDSGNEP
uniref:Uncharacterized protein n=1 Tax=Anguilla anguilla TaxID=7936 RepID=A0A0E9Q3Z5_ANGAN